MLGLCPVAQHASVSLFRPGLPDAVTSSDFIPRCHLWPPVGGHRRWCPIFHPIIHKYVLFSLRIQFQLILLRFNYINVGL